jgi:hypothetical protein
MSLTCRVLENLPIQMAGHLPKGNNIKIKNICISFLSDIRV